MGNNQNGTTITIEKGWQVWPCAVGPALSDRRWYIILEAKVQIAIRLSLAPKWHCATIAFAGLSVDMNSVGGRATSIGVALYGPRPQPSERSYASSPHR